MLYTKFKGHRSVRFGDFKGFLSYTETRAISEVMKVSVIILAYCILLTNKVIYIW